MRIEYYWVGNGQSPQPMTCTQLDKLRSETVNNQEYTVEEYWEAWNYGHQPLFSSIIAENRTDHPWTSESDRVDIVTMITGYRSGDPWDWSLKKSAILIDKSLINDLLMPFNRVARDSMGPVAQWDFCMWSPANFGTTILVVACTGGKTYGIISTVEYTVKYWYYFDIQPLLWSFSARVWWWKQKMREIGFKFPHKNRSAWGILRPERLKKWR